MKPVSCISTLIIIEEGRGVIMILYLRHFPTRIKFRGLSRGFLAKAGEICFSAAL